MKKVNDVKVCPIRHKSALHILVEYLGLDWPIKDMVTLRTLRVNELHGRRCKTFDEQLKEIEKLGYWAFCRRGSSKYVGELHYWIGGHIDNDRLTSVLAHELAHLVGYSSERAAMKIADIAGFASQLAKGVRHE